MEHSFPSCSELNRRQWLLGSAGAAVLDSTAPGAQAAKLKTRARIVVVGSGLGGLTVINRLTAMLDGAQITLIDSKQEHNYQPGYTLVATGVWPVGKVRERNADFVPSGVNWVQEMAAEFDAANNTVVTTTGQRIAYDYLVVAMGTHQDWSLIEGNWPKRPDQRVPQPPGGPSHLGQHGHLSA